MSAHLEKDGYIPKDLQATLTIEKILIMFNLMMLLLNMMETIIRKISL